MAHLLGIRTIAENLDNHVVQERLKAIGVDCAQGYYLGELQPLENLGGIVPARRGLEMQLN